MDIYISQTETRIAGQQETGDRGERGRERERERETERGRERERERDREREFTCIYIELNIVPHTHKHLK